MRDFPSIDRIEVSDNVLILYISSVFLNRAAIKIIGLKAYLAIFIDNKVKHRYALEKSQDSIPTTLAEFEWNHFKTNLFLPLIHKAITLWTLICTKTFSPLTVKITW